MAILLTGTLISGQEKGFETDTLKTNGGDLQITFIGHGTLLFQYKDMTIHVDPVGSYADYSIFPDADLILITHEHGDHLDTDAIAQIRTDITTLICTETISENIKNSMILKNGEFLDFNGLHISAVPAYNLVHLRGNGQPFHPKGVGNGYVVDFDDLRVYIAGDTENIPEMSELKEIDVAFLPMNLPYTMTPEMVADAVKMFKPRILYPYHYGETEVNLLAASMKDLTGTEIRVRQLQ